MPLPFWLLIGSLTAGITFLYCFFRSYNRLVFLSRHVPIISLFSMLGKLAKADGFVSPEEIKVIDNFINNELKLDNQLRTFVIRIFNEAKNSEVPFEVYARDFYNHFKERYDLRISMMELLVRVAHADGKYHPNKEKMIVSAIKIFRIDDALYHQVKQHYFPDTSQAYLVLDCQPDDSIDKIKGNYRKLVMKYHPDRFYSKDLPESMIKLSKEKFQEIQKAYQMIKRERAF